MSSLLYLLSYSLINIYYILRIKDLHSYLLDMSQLCYYYINPQLHKHILCLYISICISMFHFCMSISNFFFLIYHYLLMLMHLHKKKCISILHFCISISNSCLWLSSRGIWIPVLTVKKLRLNLLTIEPNKV